MSLASTELLNGYDIERCGDNVFTTSQSVYHATTDTWTDEEPQQGTSLCNMNIEEVVNKFNQTERNEIDEQR